jgi:hypothetical protein
MMLVPIGVNHLWWVQWFSSQMTLRTQRPLNTWLDFNSTCSLQPNYAKSAGARTPEYQWHLLLLFPCSTIATFFLHALTTPRYCLIVQRAPAVPSSCTVSMRYRNLGNCHLIEWTNSLWYAPVTKEPWLCFIGMGSSCCMSTPPPPVTPLHPYVS